MNSRPSLFPEVNCSDPDCGSENERDDDDELYADFLGNFMDPEDRQELERPQEYISAEECLKQVHKLTGPDSTSVFLDTEFHTKKWLI